MKAIDPQWEQIHRNSAWGRYPAEEIVRFVARNYFKRPRREVRFLDLGCGGGANTWFLCREGFTVFSFDGSFSAACKCRDYLEQMREAAGIFQADAACLPIRDNSFDCIVDVAAICSNHAEAVKIILGEAFRTLKPGGRIISSGLFKPTMTGFGTGEKIDDHTYRNMTEGALANVGTVHFFTIAEIERLWSEAGFVELRIDSLERSDGDTLVAYHIATAQKPESF